jgi:hypothetical protein
MMRPFFINNMIKSSKKAQAKKRLDEQLYLKARLEAFERDKSIGGMCIACLFNVPLKNGRIVKQRAVDYNHCVPRSQIHDLEQRHSLRNLAPTCREHHEEHDRRAEFWLPLMAELYGYDYSDQPFARYMIKEK